MSIDNLFQLFVITFPLTLNNVPISEALRNEKNGWSANLIAENAYYPSFIYENWTLRRASGSHREQALYGIDRCGYGGQAFLK
jgi:hypothetical protein